MIESTKFTSRASYTHHIKDRLLSLKPISQFLKMVSTSAEKMCSADSSKIKRDAFSRKNIFLNRKQYSHIPTHQKIKLIEVQMKVMGYFDRQITQDKNLRETLIKSLISVYINKKKDEIATEIFNRTKALFSENTWQDISSHGTASAINRYVQTELNRMIVNTPKLTQHIGSNPNKWAVADVISGAIASELLKNPRFNEINTPMIKSTILEGIYDHYAKQYHFPDIKQTNQLFTDFAKNLDIEFLVQF